MNQAVEVRCGAELLTPYDERHLTVKVARGEGADSAGVFPLVGDPCAQDDQRRVHGGLAVFEAHALGPRPVCCRQREASEKGGVGESGAFMSPFDIYTNRYAL